MYQVSTPTWQLTTNILIHPLVLILFVLLKQSIWPSYPNVPCQSTQWVNSLNYCSRISHVTLAFTLLIFRGSMPPLTWIELGCSTNLIPQLNWFPISLFISFLSCYFKSSTLQQMFNLVVVLLQIGIPGLFPVVCAVLYLYYLPVLIIWPLFMLFHNSANLHFKRYTWIVHCSYGNHTLDFIYFLESWFCSTH